MKILEPTTLKKIIWEIVRKDAKVDRVIGSLMVSAVYCAFKKSGQKNFILTNKDAFRELAEAINIGSEITLAEAKTILYAIMGWFICQKEKEICLQSSNGSIVGSFKIEKGDIKFARYF